MKYAQQGVGGISEACAARRADGTQQRLVGKGDCGCGGGGGSQQGKVRNMLGTSERYSLTALLSRREG